MKVKTEQFTEEAARTLTEGTLKLDLLKLMPAVLLALRDMSMATFPDPEAALELSAAIRGEALSRLPELLEEFEKNAIANGAKVFWARTAEEANDYILKVVKEKGATYVTKGKSMITEEMGLNDHLEENGIKPMETDLGEFIAQLLKRPPFHMVGPAANVPVEEVCELFMKEIGLKEPTNDPVELGYAARVFLRDKFHKMQVGVTGVNFAVADTGSIINVENEGNIRLNKSSPEVQISVMSIEKVVPTLMDAIHMTRMVCRSCTGQKMASYVSIDSGPKNPEAIDGPEELHIVILDNGRSEFYADKNVRRALRCIRCGACSNICPVYTKVGGYPYGWVYSGPIGQILNSLLLGIDKTVDLVQACTLCGACEEICPVGVDHPRMISQLRAMQAEAGFVPEKFTYDMFSFAGAHPSVWGAGSTMARIYVNRKKEADGKIRSKIGPVEGYFKDRDLQALPNKRFRDLWDE